MNNIYFPRLIAPVLIFNFILASLYASALTLQQHNSWYARDPGVNYLTYTGTSPGEKKPRSITRAEKKQKAKDRKIKKDYIEAVNKTRKRSYEIQTPEVKERMKQNKRRADAFYKSKRRNTRESTKKAGRKYN